MLRSPLASGPSPRTESHLLRVVLVGSEPACAHLRAQAGDALTIAGEFRDLPSARAALTGADAFIIANEGAARPDQIHQGNGGQQKRFAKSEDPAYLDREPGYSERLTDREIGVLTLLAEGLSNKGIAARLDISDQTVKFHVASILGKLGAHTRTEAVHRAMRRGLVTL
jgi:DNA-binding NarL/FixJ family response regulator